MPTASHAHTLQPQTNRGPFTIAALNGLILDIFNMCRGSYIAANGANTTAGTDAVAMTRVRTGMAHKHMPVLAAANFALAIGEQPSQV